MKRRTDYLRIAPDLDILVTWSLRMSEALDKRYRNLRLGLPEDSEYLRTGYNRWLRAHDAAFDQIHLFFTLTNSLPMVGDRLWLASSCGGEILYIEQRMLFSSPDSATLLLVYEVCSAEIEELEEYREGDFIEGSEDEEVVANSVS